MARKRMIEPDIWTDEGFVELSMPARLLWLGLISNADDEGRGIAGTKSLKTKIFPADVVTDDQLAEYRAEVEQHMNVTFYGNGTRQYYQLMKWGSHQYVQHRKKSTIPVPSCDGNDTVPLAHNELTNESMNELINARTHARRDADSGVSLAPLLDGNCPQCGAKVKYDEDNDARCEICRLMWDAQGQPVEAPP